MPQSKILLDSNSYFRLARSIHPLLDIVFGEQQYCLYVLQELDDEYDKSPVLKNKFNWVNDEKYFQNRRKRLVVSNSQKREIYLTVEHLKEYKIVCQLGISSVDIQCLAQGYVLDIPIATDDIDMLVVAEEFDISTMRTLELMALMLKCEHITMTKIREIAAYWNYIEDKPANFRKDFKRLFNEDPP